jgi:DNA-binding response OmpR family regulator
MPARILIVDDHPKNIQVIASHLNKEKYHLSFATEGKKALDIVESNKFDLILLDINMPEMDGFEVCKTLQENERSKSIPVIFLSANTDEESIKKGFSLGAVDYITKPFNASEVLARVKTHIELKKSRESLIEQKKELEKEIDIKNKFFSIISHDLKGNFGYLISASTFLVEEAESLSSEDLLKFVAGFKKTSEVSFQLLENLLMWSRSQTNRIEFAPQVIDLYEVSGGIIAIFKNVAKEKEIDLRNNVPEKLFVKCDLNMINLVIRNLVSNSIKFTHKKGVISILAEASDKNVEIKIIDTGVGMNEETIKKLFRIDIKHSTTGTAGESGTGLGINLCSDFLSKHNSKLEISSQVGKGSTFSFKLPLVETS